MKLRDYIKGSRRGKDAQHIEQQAMCDPLLGDALEGYDKVSGDHDASLERLRARIAARSAAAARAVPDRRLFYKRIAAAAVLLIGLTTGTLLYVLEDEPQSQSMIAYETSHGKDAPQEVDSPPQPAATAAQRAEKASEEPARTQVARQRTEEIEEVESPVLEIAANESRLAIPVIADAHIEEERIESDFSDPHAESEALELRIGKQLSGIQADSIDVSMARHAKSASKYKTIRGRVVEVGSGEPIAGASVLVKGTQSGTITNAEGFFALPDTELDAKIAARFIGYEEKIVPADTSVVMLIAMAPDEAVLDEVVVVGYGTAKKEVFVGSATAIAPADTTTTPRFRDYLAHELVELGVKGGPKGSATLEFEVNKKGRPHRIVQITGSSPEVLREARRILRDGPDWEPSERKRRITISF